MKILITGALGHIGSSLIRELPYMLKNIDNVTLLDNLSSQRYPSLFNLPNHKYTFIQDDIRNTDMDKILVDIDYVIHLAAITDAAGSFSNAEEVERNNYECTKVIANACLKHNVKLITLSSTSVYGTQDEVVSEDCSLDDLNPQSPYAKTKLLEEELVIEMCNRGLNAVICRFGTIFGDSIGMRFHTAVNKFCWQAIHRIPLTVWSSAYEQKRPYLDLKDATNSFKHLIEKDLFDGEIYNVLTDNFTVKNVIDEIEKNIPDLKIEYVDNKIMNQLSYDVSNNKFINTGFQFKGSLQKSIKETIELFTYR